MSAKRSLFSLREEPFSKPSYMELPKAKTTFRLLIIFNRPFDDKNEKFTDFNFPVFFNSACYLKTYFYENYTALSAGQR